MGVSGDVRDALRTQLFAVAGLPAGRKLQGEPFTATLGSPWLRETLKPLPEYPVAFGGGGLLQLDGLALYDLFYPAGAGTTAIEAMADSVIAAFRPGTALATAGGLLVRVRRAYHQGVQDDPPSWVVCPVTIQFWVQRPNTA